MVFGDVVEYRNKRSEPDGVVLGNCDVVGTVFLGRQSDVAAGLAGK